MRVGPVLRDAVFFPADGLNGLPADEGVVADERSAVATADSELDGGVDQVGLHGVSGGLRET